MTHFLISCPHCGKTILAEDNVTNIACPYCGETLDARMERAALLEKKKDANSGDIRALMGEKRFEEARDMALSAAAMMDAKAPFFALILECDLPTHHLFFFDAAAIQEDVHFLKTSKDYASFKENGLAEVLENCKNALETFQKDTMSHLVRFKGFVGERYDALRRLTYVSGCIRSLNILEADVLPMAKECSEGIAKIVRGDFGNVFNIPKILLQEITGEFERLSNAFELGLSLTLQQSPNAETKAEHALVCPICDTVIPDEDSELLTCPNCRRRIAKEEAKEAGAMQNPISLQERLQKAKKNNDINEMADMVSSLIQAGEPQANLAIPALLTELNEITPLSLSSKDFIDWLKTAQDAKVDGADEATKESVDHFKNILAILKEYEGQPHGPDGDFIQALSKFIEALPRY